MKYMIKVGNRMPRTGRVNPGRRHLAGADVSGRMQRQYEHILASARQSRRFASDRDRKRIAAMTVRKLAANPGLLEGLLGGPEADAEQAAEDFHGRPVQERFEVTERELYDSRVWVLGWLEELGIVDPDDYEFIWPIRFDYGENNDNTVFVCGNPAKTNIEFLGGDQDIDWDQVAGATTEGKYLVYVGEVQTIAYYTDKHHLTGPRSQKYGTSYEHEFGEPDEDDPEQEPGELPHLVFDRRNKKLWLVGGSYTITPEGIAG